MKKIIATIKKCLENGDLYSALYVSLALVGTCSVKQYPDIKGESKIRDVKRYTDWIDKFYLPLLQNESSPFEIESMAIYRLRCSVLHESTNVLKIDDENNVRKIILTDTGSHRNQSTASSEGESVIEIQFSVKLFVRELITAIQEWKTTAESNGINTNCDFEIFSDRWSSTNVGGGQGFHNCC